MLLRIVEGHVLVHGDRILIPRDVPSEDVLLKSLDGCVEDRGDSFKCLLGSAD